MSLSETIKSEYPELTDLDFLNGTIALQNDGDEAGDYIAAWNYSKPLPKGLKVGK